MVPISLSLQGFYSYKDKQTIDFNSLTKAGVFGIFGQTGAGKSAIIEAIMLALYGDIERINNREERSYNVMNLQSKELFIEFICFSHITQTKYTITVKAKRSSKNFEQVSKLDRICYKLVDSKWIPINLEDIQKEITCLSYNNFKQTVIIPQGKFMEFLQLSPTERTGMLKDLFNLHEYELSEKVKIVEGEIIQQKSRIEGNIQEIGEIDETVLATIQQKENELLTLGIEQKKQLDTLQENLKKLYLIKQDFDEFEKTKLIHKELLSKEQEFKELEKTISLISLCVKYIAPIYDTLQLKQNDAGKLQSIITNAKQEFQKIEIRFNESKKIFEELEQKFIQLPEFKQNTNFIKQCYELKNVEKQIETQTLKQQEFAKKIETLEKTQKTNEYSLQEQKELRKQLQQNVPDISSIYKQKHELEKYNTICNRIEECREKRIQYEHEIQTLKQQVCDSAFTVFKQKIDYKDIKEIIEDKIKHCENIISHIDAELQQALLFNHVNTLRKTLQHGTACPVCGSTEHNIEKIASEYEPNIQDIEQKKIRISFELQSYTKLLQLLHTTNNHITVLQKQDHEISHTMHSLTIERNLQEPDFEIRDISVFEKELERITSIQQQMKNIENELIEFEKKQKDIISELTIAHEQLIHIKTSHTETKTRFSMLKESIPSSLYNTYGSFDEDSLIQEIEKRSKQQIEIETSYTSIKQEYILLKEQYNLLKISILEKEKSYKIICEDIQQLQEKLTFAINTHSFDSTEQIENLLNQKESLLEYSQRLEHYKHALSTIETSVNTLSKKLEGVNFDTNEFEQLKQTIEKAEHEIQITRDAYIRANEQRKQLQTKLQKQSDLLKQLAICKNDLDTITTLKSLFKQSGFVSYMSSNYIHMICKKANERFILLTKHALQLEVENNSFVVRDFLNNGKLRHIKTLSGGQAFQAALSLALALSESVQLHSPYISNFFFIDEGFGSQDKESLSVVFETLRSLQKEGKIVGIISHVEELKENIPIYIQVQNNQGMSVIQ